MKILLRSHRGLALLGVAIALAILGSMAAALSALVAANQKTGVAQQYLDQGFYLSHAALEYSLRNTKSLHNCTVPSRNFLTQSLGITTGSKIASVTTYGSGGIFSTDSFSITKSGTGGGGPCIYALANSGSGTFSMTGTGSLNASTCGLQVNSSSCGAADITGSGVIKVSSANIVGDLNVTGSGGITITPSGSITHNAATTDPITANSALATDLTNTVLTAYPTCTQTNYSYSGTGTVALPPGRYCGGIRITAAATINLTAGGQYIIDGGSFSVTGSGTINGTGVTLFLVKQLKSGTAALNFTGSPNINITAPTSGTWNGIAVYQGASVSSGTSSIVGSSGININGVIYLPKQMLTFTGGSSSSPACTMLIANQLSITGSTNISCASGALNGYVASSC